MEPDFWSKLTDSEKETYGQLQAVLGSPGWKVISRDLNDILEGLRGTLDNPPTWDAHVYARGVRDGLFQLIGLEERITLEFQNAVAQRELEAETTEAPAVEGEPYV